VAVRRVGDSPAHFDLGLVGSNHARRGVGVVHVLLRVVGVRRRASVPFEQRGGAERLPRSMADSPPFVILCKHVTYDCDGSLAALFKNFIDNV